MRAGVMTTTVLAGLILLGACGKKDAPDETIAAKGFTPPTIRPPTPIAGQAQTTPITAYIGKYPHDAVEGVDFFDRTDVANGLVEAVGDAKLRETIRGRSGPETPIFRLGTRVAAWGCEQHNCGDRNWTVIVDPKTRGVQACYHDADTMKDTSRWYAREGTTTRAGACPSEE